MHVSMCFSPFLCIAASPLMEPGGEAACAPACYYNAADGQGFTKWFRRRWNVLCAGVCLHTAVGRHWRGITDITAELWSSVALRIPLVQGQLLFLVAVTEREAGPAPPSLPTSEDHQTLPPSSGIKLSLAGRPEPLESAWDWLGWCCLRAPSPTSCSSTRSHCHSLGSCCHRISLLEVKTWLSLAGAGFVLLFLLPQPGSWGWSLLLSLGMLCTSSAAAVRDAQSVFCAPGRWCELCIVSLLPGGMVLIWPVLKK